MKISFPLVLLRWLVAAALFDWLVTRTLTRSAIFMPKPPPVLLAYQALGLAGQVALSLTSLLALSALGWIAWHTWQTRHTVGLPLALLGQAILSLLFLVIAPVGWLALIGHFCYLLAVALCLLPGWFGQNKNSAWRPAPMVAYLLPALALISGRLHQALPAWYATWQWPGPPPLTGLLFNLGELLIVLSCLALWWVYGRGARWPVWLGAALPALALSGAHLTNAAMTGILAVWSMGLTLYLPWPLYALSLWCAVVTVMATRQSSANAVGWAILLLAASGYAPQLSVQAALSLIALWLLATPAPDRVAGHAAPPALQPRPTTPVAVANA